MEGQQQPLVTITGISGYLGAQVCKHFLENGAFRVRGTVRSVSNPAKIDPLKEAFGDDFDKLELKEADLLDEASMLAACEGSTFIVHTASPFNMTEKDESKMVKPAVEGTLAVMKAAQKNKVSKVVITSSMVAVFDVKDKTQTYFTPNDWSEPEGQSSYSKSKTLAEKAAWEFQKNLPEGERFDLVSINPGFLIGPNLNKAEFTSGNMIKMMMMG